DCVVKIVIGKDGARQPPRPTRRRRSWTVEMALRAPDTTWLARARAGSSASRASSSSALARMTPSWLLRRWKRRASSGCAPSSSTPAVGFDSGATAEPFGPPVLGIVLRVALGLAPQRIGEDP